MRVFVAGPYTKGDVGLNVRNAMQAGMELIRNGHHPYVPHLTHFLHMQDPQPYAVWCALDNEYLQFCEALVRLPGESSGADAEVKLAEALGIPVYYSVHEFLNYVHPRGV